ncbi:MULTISPECIES: hypothetical protein [unclassified Halomonas]|uniref:hypothetical protein n=1 Tax=unclassified Halomonas TaxID=2609666 RepID=UPI0013B357A3|nr:MULTISPECIES: hypothetical protein [unclassified Halomonas]MBR9878774.1 hypothetical protein [Gammaproteobacteria bacterium]
MNDRSSLYDRLRPRRSTLAQAEQAALLSLDTRHLIVDDAWLLCGKDDINTILITQEASAADKVVPDSLIRDDQRHHVGVAPMRGIENVPLEQRSRSRQLLQLLLPRLTTSPPGWADARIILQCPEGVTATQWLDDVLAIWPIQNQPKRGLEVTTSTFDNWLEDTLSSSTDTCALHQFIMLAPTPPSEPPHSITSDVVATLWLRRVPARATNEEPMTAPSLGVTLRRPERHQHASRSNSPPKSQSVLAALLPPSQGLDQVSETARLCAITWDGDPSGQRLDQLIDYIQHLSPDLNPVSDLWSVRNIARSLNDASPVVQLVIACHLAKQRQGPVLLLDTHQDTQTITAIVSPGPPSH